MKFHLIAPMPSKPGFSRFNHWNSGSAPLPFTSTLAMTGNVTS